MKTNEKIIAITAIVAILAAVMLMGCIDKEVSTPITNSEFKNITTDALDDIVSQLEKIVVAEDKGDFVTAKSELAAFDISMRQYIAKFEKMAVTENAIPSKKAIISAFEGYRLTGEYYDAYLENPTVEEYARCNAQAINATKQMDIAAMLAGNL